jgi:hypothetical protein
MSDGQKEMIRHLRKARVCKDGVRRQPHKHERNAADLIEAQAAEIERLRAALVKVDLKIRSFIGADQRDVEFIRAALAQETQP